MKKILLVLASLAFASASYGATYSYQANVDRGGITFVSYSSCGGSGVNALFVDDQTGPIGTPFAYNPAKTVTISNAYTATVNTSGWRSFQIITTINTCIVRIMNSTTRASFPAIVIDALGIGRQ